MKRLFMLLLVCLPFAGSAQCEAAFITSGFLPPNEDGLVIFGNQSDPWQGAGVEFLWNFGDGSTGDGLGPEHQYAEEGYYEVCLTLNVYEGNDLACSDTYCETIFVDIDSDGCDFGEEEIIVSATVCCGGEFGNSLVYSIFNEDNWEVVNWFEIEGNDQVVISATHCLTPACYDVQLDFSNMNAMTEQLIDFSITGENVGEMVVNEEWEGLPWNVSFCVGGNTEGCPSELWTNDGTACGEHQFEIGSFVEGEAVTWHINDVVIEGGHFLEYNFEEAGVYQICAEYTSPACSGVVLCTEKTIECENLPDCELNVQLLQQTCELLVLHGTTNVEGTIEWTLDGQFYTQGYTPTFIVEEGSHTICALFEGEGCAGADDWCETFEIDACSEECTEVSFDLDSYINEGGVTYFEWELSNTLTEEVIEDGIAQYSVEDPFYDASFCLEDGCYTLTAYSSQIFNPEAFTYSFSESWEIVNVSIVESNGAMAVEIDLSLNSICSENTSCNLEPTLAEAGCEIAVFHSNVETEVAVFWSYDGETIGVGQNIEIEISEGLHTICAWYITEECGAVEWCETYEFEDCGGNDCPDQIWSGATEECGLMHFEIGSFVEGEDVVWYPGDGSGAVEGGHFFAHQYEAPGVYNVCAWYTSPACPDGVELCTVIEVPECDGCPWTLYSDIAAFCGVYQFQVGGGTDGSDVIWYPGDGSGPEEGDNMYSHLYAEPGEYEVCAFYTSDECPGGVELCTSITVDDCDECPGAIMATQVDCDSYIFFIAGTETGNVTWHFGDQISETSGTSADHTYNEDGIYIVTAIYSGPGCTNGVTIIYTVNVNCEAGEDCPTEIWSGATEDCTLWHFEIGSFVEGEEVAWYFDNNQQGVEAGHFIAHEFMVDGIHSVCAYYTSPACPEGVYLCTEVEVNCAGEDCNIEISAVQTGEFSYTFTATGNPEVNPMHWTVNGGEALEATWVFDAQFEGPGIYTICGWVENLECGVVEDCIEIEVAGEGDCNLNVEVLQQECELLVLQSYSTEEAMIHWAVDGQPAGMGNTYTFPLSAGTYEICAWYETEECGEVAWCETFTINGCDDCTEVNFGMDSFTNEGGPEVAYWLLLDDEGALLDQGSAAYNANDPYNDFSLCLEDGCYVLVLEGLNVTGTAFDVLINIGGASVIQDSIIMNDNLYEITFGVNSDCTSGGDCEAGFEPIYTNTPGHIEFVNTSSGEDAQYVWNYGDGQTSDGTGGNVWYSENGVYEVCLTIYSGDCMDTYCQQVIVTGMEGGCDDNTVVLNISSEYSSENLFDIIDISLEYNNEQFESWIVTTTTGFEGSVEACLPDGCYELILTSEAALLANYIEVEVTMNGEMVDILNVLNNSNEGMINFGLNADCPDNVTESATGTWLIYPNPTSSLVNLQHSTGDRATRIEVVDITGRSVLNFVPNMMSADVSMLSSGQYFVRIYSEKGMTTLPLNIQN